jgi:biotin carboxylase
MSTKPRERLLILGAGIMQGPALRLARDMGLETVAVDGDPRAPSAVLADRFECIDLKDREGIEALGRSLMAGGGLSGIMTAGTDFSATVAWVAGRLGLPGIPYEAALNASDKERMRRCFREAHVPSPDFRILREVPGPDFSLPFAYPAVVKPVDNMGSRGCRRVDTPAELEAAVPDALRFSRSGRVIVEEYMEGPEFSVDAIVYRGKITICGLADRHIFFPPYFIEMGHTMPAILEEDSAEALLRVFTDGVRALGLLETGAVGAAKGDVKLSPRGPMIGEIAARLSGGYMSGWTYPYASGAEPTRGAITVALGKPPEGLEPRLLWTSAERAFISIPGRAGAIRGIEEARALPRVKDIFLRVEPGKDVRFPENNVTKCGNVITAAPGREEAVFAAEEAARRILIRLEAPNAETDRFLEGGLSPEPRFPPDAFPITAELAVRFGELPETTVTAAPGIDSAAGPPVLSLIPFPAFTQSGLRDYGGRTVEESLEAIRRLTKLSLPLPSPDRPGHGVLGRSFWTALIRGGYQGGVYFLDRLIRGRGRETNG